MYKSVRQFATAMHNHLHLGRRKAQAAAHGHESEHESLSSRPTSPLHGDDGKPLGQHRAAAGSDDNIVPLNETDRQWQERTVRLLRKGTTLRGKFFVLLEEPKSSTFAYLLHLYFLILVLAGTTTFCLETITPLVRTLEQQETWFAIDSFIMCSWTVEFILRFWCSPRYVRSWFVFVDFIAIMPFFMILIIAELRGEDPNNPDLVNNTWVRMIKLLRVLRLLKFTRASEKIMLLFRAIKRSTDGIITLAYVLSLATILFSSCMFYSELTISYFDEEKGMYIYTEGLRAGDVTPFQSILDAFYWCIVTMTTVGYGDAYPSSYWGKFVAAMTMVSSMMILAFPATIIGANLTEVYQEYREQKAAELLRIQRREERERMKHLNPDHGIDSKVIEALNRSEKMAAESVHSLPGTPREDLPMDIKIPRVGAPVSSFVSTARLAAEVCENELIAAREKLMLLETRMNQLRTILSMLEISAAGGVGPIGLGGLIDDKTKSTAPHSPSPLSRPPLSLSQLHLQHEEHAEHAARREEPHLQQQQQQQQQQRAPARQEHRPADDAPVTMIPMTVFVAADEEQNPVSYNLEEIRVADDAPLLKLDETDMQ